MSHNEWRIKFMPIFPEGPPRHLQENPNRMPSLRVRRRRARVATLAFGLGIVGVGIADTVRSNPNNCEVVGTASVKPGRGAADLVARTERGLNLNEIDASIKATMEANGHTFFPNQRAGVVLCRE